jgi:hypothetical protein
MTFVGFVEQLDELDRTERTPAEKMREALAMYDEGLAIQRQTLRRRYPRLTPEEVERKLSRWLLREESE